MQKVVFIFPLLKYKNIFYDAISCLAFQIACSFNVFIVVAFWLLSEGDDLLTLPCKVRDCDVEHEPCSSQKILSQSSMLQYISLLQSVQCDSQKFFILYEY